MLGNALPLSEQCAFVEGLNVASAYQLKVFGGHSSTGKLSSGYRKFEKLAQG